MARRERVAEHLGLKIACSLGDGLHVLSSQNMLVMVLLASGFDHLMRSPGADFFALSLDDILHEPQVAITKANTGAPGRRAGAVSAVGRFLLKTFGRGEIAGGRLGGWRQIGWEGWEGAVWAVASCWTATGSGFGFALC